MFPFFKRRDDGPLSVEDAVFTPEDIFVLLGESLDLGCFAAQPRNLNLGRFKAEGSAAWRERLVKRFGPRGLVDDSGEPCPRLQAALAPLAGHGVFIADGDSPDRDDPVEHRTAVLCLTPDLSRATAVVRDGRGFRLRPFPEERALWEAEFLDLFGLSDRFAWAERAQHYIGGGVRLEDSTFSDALKGGGNAVRRWCCDRGIADSLQLQRVSEMGNRVFSGLSAKEMLSTDLRQSVFPEDFGYGVPVPVAGQFRTKGTLIFPEVALVHFWGVSPREGFDWFDHSQSIELCRYAGFDFLGPGEGLLDNLLNFYDYPEGGNEY